MSDSLQLAIKAFHELRGALPEGLVATKPEGASDKWWEDYKAAAEAADPNAPRGERGVSMQIVRADGTVVESGVEGEAPKAEVEGEAVIKIYGYVERWTLQDFDYFLSRAGSRPVRVRIASPGGDAGVGLQIYTMIRKRGGVVTEADGPIASAASVIFLAGQERLIPEEAASVMVHRSWLFTCMAGNVNAWTELVAKIANVLRVIDDGMAAVLAARIGGKRDAAMEYLDAETYFSPEECKEMGIATGYCEYADEGGETDPQDGEQAGDSCDDEDERMQGKAPASEGEKAPAAGEAKKPQQSKAEDGEEKEDEEMAGGDHGNEPRDEEEAGGDHPKDGAQDEGGSPASEESKDGDKEDDADMQASDRPAPEAAATAVVHSEEATPGASPYPAFLREEL